MSHERDFWRAIEEDQEERMRLHAETTNPLRGLTTAAEFAAKAKGILELLTTSRSGYADLASVCSRVHELVFVEAGSLFPEAIAHGELSSAQFRLDDMSSLREEIARDDIATCLDTRRKIAQLLRGVTPVPIRRNQQHFKPGLKNIEALRLAVANSTERDPMSTLEGIYAKLDGDTLKQELLRRADPFGDINLSRVLRLNWQDAA